MLDSCFWFYLCNTCSGTNCKNCKKYIDVQSEQGLKLMKEYQSDLDKFLQPLTMRWQEKMKNFNKTA